MAHSEFGSQRNQTRYSVEAPLRRRSCPQQALERRLSLLHARPGGNCRLWPQLSAPYRSRSCDCCLPRPCRLPRLFALVLQGTSRLGPADPRYPKTQQILSFFSFDNFLSLLSVIDPPTTGLKTKKKGSRRKSLSYPDPGFRLSNLRYSL